MCHLQSSGYLILMGDLVNLGAHSSRLDFGQSRQIWRSASAAGTLIGNLLELVG
jgi:hypothetical protein